MAARAVLIIGLLSWASLAFGQSPGPETASNQSDSWTPPPVVAHPSVLGPYGASADWGKYSIGRIVSYGYSSDQTYTILARPLAITDIALAAGEKLVTLAVGDTSRWEISDDGQNIYIKPVRAGLYTSATLQTSLHRYQLIFVSVAPGAPWYQQVSWHTGGVTVYRGASSNPDMIAKKKTNKTAEPRGSTTELATINTDYSISGEASWRPIGVYDNGHSTVFRLSHHIQEMPALFVRLNPGAPYSIANYMVHKDALVYPHLIYSAVLVLGDKKIFIKRRGQ